MPPSIASDCRRLGGSKQIQAELLFGRSLHGGGAVSDADWARFLADTVTPHFPDGLTAFDATGQWRNGAGQIGREPSKMLLIVAPDGAATIDALKQVAAIYKSRFGQDSVGIVIAGACASF